MQETLQTIARKLREAAGAIADLKALYPNIPDVQALPDISESVAALPHVVEVDPASIQQAAELAVAGALAKGLPALRLVGNGHDLQLRVDADGTPRFHKTNS